MGNNWPKVKLGDVLTHRKEFVIIDDLAVYRRPRVQLHAQGVVLRDEIQGALIKTKGQQVCRAGEFLVAEIDAKVGGYGLVPEALDGCIVSSHYFLFALDDTKLERKFLDFYVRTPGFAEQVAAQGSTNYAAIRPSHVLRYEMPLPPLQEQRGIVARIGELAAKIKEVRELQKEAEGDTEAFVVSTHLHFAGSRIMKLGEILNLDEDAVVITPSGEYPQVGVKGFGGGLFPKSPVLGTETTYRAFNRLYDGALVLSQVKGWEGAIAVCGADLAGWFVSPEYRTFRCIPTKVRPKYLAALVRTPWFWERLTDLTRGVGARRERTRPEQFLDLQMPMPNLSHQETSERMFDNVNSIRGLQTESISGLSALMPSILDKVFRGEL